ncbi:hypothetical protein B0J17DRAFT_348030 [Rhizoctonia solani]|nr:hypothetical protein B0J17DRAFT_348030 [Rhizoctonia solani]
MLCHAHLTLRYQGLVKKPLERLGHISIPTTFAIVVDGLDEFSDHCTRENLLKKLYEMSRLVPWLKVIIAGRPVGDIQEFFHDDHPHSIIVHLQDYDALPDIRAYIEWKVGDIAEKERWPSDSINRLCAMSQGVFLWAAVAIKYIKKSTILALLRLQTILNNQRSPVTDHFDACT